MTLFRMSARKLFVRIRNYLVIFRVFVQPFDAVWIQVVRKNSTSFLRSRDGEGSDARKDICDYPVLRLEDRHEPLMLGM